MYKSIYLICNLLFAGFLVLLEEVPGQQDMPFKVPETEKHETPMPEEEKSEADLYLDKIYLKYDLPLLHGLKAINLGLWVRESEDPVLAAMNGAMRIDYVWEYPFIEDIAALEGSKELNQRLKEMLRDVWRDVVAGTVFGDLDRKDKTMETVDRADGGKDTVIHLFSKDRPRGEIVFDGETGRARSGTLLRRGLPYAWEPTYATYKGRWRLESRRCIPPSVDDEDDKKIVRTYHYEDFERVNRFTLPTKLTVEGPSGRTVFDFEFFFVNREIAIRGEEGRRKVLKKIDYFEKHYGEVHEFKRLRMMKKLASTGHDLAAECILHHCLDDESFNVREESVRVLGLMGCRNVAQALAGRLLERSMDPEFYIAYIEALGNLGDPATVEALSREFLLGFDKDPDIETARARLESLGKIRSRRAVEALIRILKGLDATKDASLMSDGFHALEALTGKAFDRLDAWNDWWKAQGEEYRLGEDG